MHVPFETEVVLAATVELFERAQGPELGGAQLLSELNAGGRGRQLLLAGRLEQVVVAVRGRTTADHRGHGYNGQQQKHRCAGGKRGGRGKTDKKKKITRSSC